MNNAYIRAQQCKVKEAKFPFVKIGTQYWTTKNLSLAVTPQGNLIAEMQANGNVEKIINGGFDTDISGCSSMGNHSILWDATGCGKITSTGVGTTNTDVITLQSAASTIDAYIKVSFTVKTLSGTTKLKSQLDNVSTFNDITLTSSFVTYTYYYKSQTNFIKVMRFWLTGAGEFLIDNVSIQQIGWSGSQELYDGIYAQTSGTVEQKTYAAVKAAAMWCNYNNDVAIGAVYGKLYNWFALKYFQMDIDYYNSANPTKPYIWRMPTQAEFQTLSTYLGGDAVSGGHLKEAGLAHWNSPNTGADNSSGFSALGSGMRRDIGVFVYFSTKSTYKYIDQNNYWIELSDNSTSILFANYTGIKWGHGLRLIKA